MPRLSIDITAQEHQRLKAIAALNGQSLKDFVLSRTLADVPDVSDMDDDEAMTALAGFLGTRVGQAERGETHSVPRGGLLDHLKDRVHAADE